MVTVRVSVPLTPVTVIIVVPAVAVLEAVSVRMLLAPVADVGLKTPVTPAGSPPAVSATAPVKPPVRAMPIVLVPLAPTFMLRLPGFALRVKSGI